jgi:hypothetical protein
MCFNVPSSVYIDFFLAFSLSGIWQDLASNSLFPLTSVIIYSPIFRIDNPSLYSLLPGQINTWCSTLENLRH